LLCCVGSGRLAPIRGGALAADSRATRNPIRPPASGASNPGLRVIGWQWCPLRAPPAFRRWHSTQRDSRHEGRGGSAWQLATPASVRRFMMRALPPRESALRPTPSTEPVLFYEPELPLETHLSMLLHADPPRVVAAERAFTTKSTDLWHPLSPAGTLDRHHPPRACRARRFHERARLTPTILRPPTRPTNACAPARSSDPVAFRRRYRRRPTRPEPLLRHPSEGMMQPRLGTPSTISTDLTLSHAIRSALNSELNTRTLRTPVRFLLWPWAASARFATEAWN